MFGKEVTACEIESLLPSNGISILHISTRAKIVATYGIPRDQLPNSDSIVRSDYVASIPCDDSVNIALVYKTEFCPGLRGEIVTASCKVVVR